ncbi:hypothetical protein B1808_01245 [Pseudofulvimonas gallinarii]|nr:hypothetical protein B1808_01245 [Pseudofulvimonas gallinarii]
MQSIRRQLAGLALVLAATGLAHAGDVISVADFNLPPQDSQGWSILTPSTDSRLVYVDSTGGNDGNGQVYSPSSPQIGPDPTRPVGQVQAFRTLSAAAQHLRDREPDWLLLRAGRVWQESLPTRRGRSPSERMVATSWGEGPRPELRTGAQRGITARNPENQAIIGLRFWAHTRDPEGPHFTDYAGSTGFDFITSAPGNANQVRDVLIEDCFFRSYTNNVLTGGAGREPIVRFVLRRSIVSRNFKHTDGHSQGLYHAGGSHEGNTVATILLQENLFDHNGWRIQSINANNQIDHGQATIFNHNTYFSEPRNVLFQRNMFLRASSIGTKWTGGPTPDYVATNIVLEDNLYAEGEIGISMGGNTAGPRRFKDIHIHDNVFTDIGRSRPTNRSLSWGIEAIDWESGTIQRNLLIHQRTPITNTWAIQVRSPDETGTILIQDNVMANIRAGTGGGIVQLQHGSVIDDVLFQGNTVQTPTSSAVVSLTPGGYSFSGPNRYHTAAAADRVFRINGTNTSLAQWITATGDTGATTAAIEFPAPQRDLETYVEHVGMGSGFDDFLAAIYGQSRANWNPALTAGVINDWLRGGFGMPPAGAGDRIFAHGFQH